MSTDSDTETTPRTFQIERLTTLQSGIAAWMLVAVLHEKDGPYAYAALQGYIDELDGDGSGMWRVITRHGYGSSVDEFEVKERREHVIERVGRPTPEQQQLREDIETLSRAALRPAESPVPESPEDVPF